MEEQNDHPNHHDSPQDSPQESRPPATPASNQNLILGIVMGAVVLLLLLLVISQQFGGPGDSQEDTEALMLEKQLAEMKAKAAVMATTLPNSQSASVLVDEIKRNVVTLGAIVDQSQRDLAQLNDSKATVNSLSRQLADMQRRNDLNQDAQARVNGLESQIASLRSQLENAVTKESVLALQNQLSFAQAESDKLRLDMAELQKKSAGMVDGIALAAVRSELDNCLTENNILRLEVQALRTKLDGANLFVTADNLHPKAQALFRELKRLEGSDRAALETAYAGINQNFNSWVVETTTFKTGSADLSKEYEEHLAELTKLADPQNFYLIVGYASKTGDVKKNRALSEQRATRVATIANYYKQQNQQVQAVYLGETNRFSKDPLPNQLCEIWSIRP